jgi:Leucine-rich repeat (LRR) protein
MRCRENDLEELPDSLASLPCLSTLNVSHNKLSKIPFKIINTSTRTKSDSFFSATVERATVPLPALKLLLASHNTLRADLLQIDHIPRELMEIDLSYNELGQSTLLLAKLSTLEHLKTLRLTSCGLDDSSFTPNSNLFRTLHVLDLGENEELSELAVLHSLNEREVAVGPSNSNIKGVLNVVMGKPGPAKEAWEIEAENRTKLRKSSATPDSVFSIGGHSTASVKSPKQQHVSVPPVQPEQPIKEAWEIEAEQGLLTEGGRRRARAAAAVGDPSPRPISPVDVSHLSISGSSGGPSLVQFYDGPHATLTLPRSQPQLRTHNRSFSLVATSMSSNVSDLVVPAPTMPLPAILSQSFANNIRVLILSNRRMESSIVLPSTGLASPILPHLDELDLNNCNLSSLASISSDSNQSPVSKEPVFDIIGALFPSLSILDLSYNALTTLSGVSTLMVPDPEKKRKGLTTLRLRGNRLASLEPFEELAAKWHSNGGGVEGWRGEELDLRDNEIGRVSSFLGDEAFFS